jgi:hypothetical protein
MHSHNFCLSDHRRFLLVTLRLLIALNFALKETAETSTATSGLLGVNVRLYIDLIGEMPDLN